MDFGNKKIFARNLQYYMRLSEKTRADISRDLRIPYTTVNDWYYERKYPRIDAIERLAAYFHVLKSDLIEDKTDKTDPVINDIILYAGGRTPGDAISLYLEAVRTTLKQMHEQEKRLMAYEEKIQNL